MCRARYRHGFFESWARHGLEVCAASVGMGCVMVAQVLLALGFGMQAVLSMLEGYTKPISVVNARGVH